MTPADLGYTAFGPGNPIGTGQYYYVSAVCITPPGAASACPPSTLAGPSFLVTARPMAGSSQAADTQCTSFSVDSGGGQFATGTLAQASCWQQ